jgi:hypothetical protein
MNPKNYVDYLAFEAVKQLKAKGHERWIQKCYRKNHSIAERAKAMALEIPTQKVKKSRGAIFTFYFKLFMVQPLGGRY